MKAFLLTASTLLACASGTFAQNLPPDYSWEVGINAGRNNITRPLGPSWPYQGSRTKTSNDYSVHLNYYLDYHWMLSLDLGMRQWVSEGDWKPQYQLGQTLNARPITFVVADRAINETVGINYVIPFYTKFNTYNKANLYFGATFGLLQTVNDGSMGYSKYNAAPDSGYTYMSRYNYASGTGYQAGIQIGYTWYLIPRLGINVEVGMRYSRVKTIDERNAGANDMFYLLHFPQTIGLRWRF